MKLFLLFFSICVSQMSYSSVSFVTLQQAVENQEKALHKSPNDIGILCKMVDSYNLNSQYVSAENAIKTFEKSVKKRNSHTLAFLYLAYAKTYKYENKNDKSIYYFLKAEDAFRLVKDYHGLLECGVEVIEFYRRMADRTEAEKQYYRFSFLAKKYQVTDFKIWNSLYNRFAAVLNETSRTQSSIRFSKKALELAEKINDLNAIAISYNEMGLSYKNLLKFDESIDCYMKAQNAWTKMGYYRDATHAKMNGITVATHGNLLSHEQKLKEFHVLLQLIDSFQIDYPKSPIYREIATAYTFMHDYKSAYFSLTDHHESLLSEMDSQRASEMNNIEEKYKNNQLTQENEKVVNREKEKQSELSTANDRIAIIVFALLLVVLALGGLFYLWRKLKIANKLLVKRNEQKSILVQEIHHRVKNNLQFVRSILEMQTGLNDSKDGVENLHDVSRRIDAMSLVHEMLYIEEDGMGVPVKKYLERLVHLSQTLFDQQNLLKFNFDVDDMEIPVDKVVSIGIICSELITNSVKHAFNQNDEPQFNISLRKIGASYHFEVSDNGSEEEIENKNERFGLGMRLIDIFSRQLNGTYQISRVDGYKYSLIFQL